ncbi:eukaryotic translation initiation factor eIF-2B epsilon subunit [Klebsormidium nitens]|uniref:Translation initiation factor eIF2B subunit epsilon n=1 Tax=Klebsormidium nitens TaxID=105231 RepID=A0A0U9HIS8_KLENI|nr:eukaryotic translation initiation factor eIF-2B epsilon subunit [Klebsormidium nitens]|eukprot:GAQ80574.1 eukaryotic translation initiation factor eIF-2B epsilon subunit [Klebsormidium nitens]
MAPRKGPPQEVADEEAQGPLQAILLADSFAQKFKPITLERPKMLLPVANVPMIDYTLEWLASAGVEDVLVFCCAHARQIQAYIETSKWKKQPNFHVTPIVSHNSMSAGEALRLIDEKNLIRNDFILISGDTISNMSLDAVLAEHKARRAKDKQAIMTMVVKQAKPDPVTHLTRLGNEELLAAIDPQTKQLLLYDHGKESGGREGSKGGQYLGLERAMFEGRQAVQLRTDLEDCFIDICAPEVLMLFTDNFDYQHLRRDFVKGLLSDEIMGNKIYTYELTREYAARIDNLRSYDTVSKDVIHRWAYPFVLDTMFGNRPVNVKLGRTNIYKEEDLKIARTAVIGENTVLGEKTVVGERTIIQNSVIGSNCVIGANVRIYGSYVWNDVKIGNGAVLTSAVVCDNVLVKDKAVVEPGAVLSFKVEVGGGFRVPAYSRISMLAQPMEDDDSDEELEYDQAGVGGADAHKGSDDEESEGAAVVPISWNPEEVGVAGKGCRWAMVREGAEDDEWKQSVAPIPAAKLADLAAAAAEDNSRDENAMDVSRSARASAQGDEETDEEDQDSEFLKEVGGTFRRGVVEKIKQENVQLEINGLKLAYNKTFAECASGVFKTMLVMTLEGKPASPAATLTALKKLLTQWGSLLKKFLTGEEDEAEVLLTLEEACEEKPTRDFGPLFAKVAQLLYDEDVLSEEGLFQWEGEKRYADESDKKYLNQCKIFLTWLREADEESEEESDDDSPLPAKAKAAAAPVEHSEDEDEADVADVSGEKARVSRADSPESRSPTTSISGDHAGSPGPQKAKGSAGRKQAEVEGPSVKRDLSFQLQDLEDDEARRNGETTDEEEEEVLSEVGSAGKRGGALAKVAEEEEREGPTTLPPSSIDYENDGKYLKGSASSEDEETREVRQPIKHDQAVDRRKSGDSQSVQSRGPDESLRDA